MAKAIVYKIDTLQAVDLGLGNGYTATVYYLVFGENQTEVDAIGSSTGWSYSYNFASDSNGAFLVGVIQTQLIAEVLDRTGLTLSPTDISVLPVSPWSYVSGTNPNVDWRIGQPGSTTVDIDMSSGMPTLTFSRDGTAAQTAQFVYIYEVDADGNFTFNKLRCSKDFKTDGHLMFSNAALDAASAFGPNLVIPDNTTYLATSPFDANDVEIDIGDGGELLVM